MVKILRRPYRNNTIANWLYIGWIKYRFDGKCGVLILLSFLDLQATVCVQMLCIYTFIFFLRQYYGNEPSALCTYIHIRNDEQ